MPQSFSNVVAFLEANAAVYGVRIVVAILILVIGIFAARTARGASRRMLDRGRVDSTLVAFLGELVYGSVIVLVVVLALNQVGVETASLVALLGAAGLAIGLALQGSLANFASGMMLILLRPIRIGDLVELAGTVGTVRNIEIFTTHLASPDNKAIVIPNSKVMSDKIVNYTLLTTRRVELEYPVPADKDVFELRDHLRELVSQDNRILKEPAPQLDIVGSKADAKIVLRPWVSTTEYDSVTADLREKLLRL
jgi:small conductance mechanosensitive channel